MAQEARAIAVRPNPHDLERSGERRVSVPILSIATSGSARRNSLAHRADGGRRDTRDDRDKRLIVLLERRVGERPRIREEAAHVRVGRDADDGGRRARPAGRRARPAVRRRRSSKNLPRGELADDEDARRAGPIAIVKAHVREGSQLRASGSRRRGGGAGSCAAASPPRTAGRRSKRLSALDAPKGHPPVSDTESIDGWTRNSPQTNRASAARAPRSPLGPIEIEDRNPESESESTPSRCRIRNRVLTNIVAMMKNPAAIATCTRGALGAGGPGVDPAASAPRTSTCASAGSRAQGRTDQRHEE